MDPNTQIPTTPSLPSTPPPVSPPAPPPPPQSPPPQQPNPTVDKPFLNKTALIIASSLLAVILITGLILSLFNKKSGTKTGNNTSKLSFGEDLSRYGVDTDADGYPDFIEKAVGLDPNVSEATRCEKNSCDVNLQNSSQKRNVLVVLDASGSMDLLINGQKKMNLAKQAIRDYVNKASANTNIGLLIYGHKGSNSVADKPVSCATAEIIGQIGTVTPQNIDSILAPIKPTGWTLMGRAINEGTKAFIGKEGQKNEIILVTDGEETCNSNPIGEAQTIKNSATAVTVNIIGFAVDPGAATSLIQIANAGGGTFALASNGDELDQKFNQLYENGQKALGFIQCKSGELETVNKCYQAAFDKVSQYITTAKQDYFNKKISTNEYNRLDELSSKLFTQLFNFKNDSLKKYNQTTTDIHDKAFGK